MSSGPPHGMPYRVSKEMVLELDAESDIFPIMPTASKPPKKTELTKKRDRCSSILSSPNQSLYSQIRKRGVVFMQAPAQLLATTGVKKVPLEYLSNAVSHLIENEG